MDGGYHLRFRTRGVVFAADAKGNHLDEDEPSFPVHRFGLDTAQAMLDAAVTGRGPLEESPNCPEASTIPKVAPLTEVAVGDLRSFFEAPRSSQASHRTPVRVLNDDSGAAAAIQPPPAKAEAEALETATHSTNMAGPEPVPEASHAVDDPQDDAARARVPVPVTLGGIAVPASAFGQPASTPKPESPKVHADILLGATEPTPQYGLIGRFESAKVGIDLTGCNTISLFGVQGFGKSYTLGVIAEMAAQSIAGINSLPAPLATVMFHYHRSDAYAPEYATAIAPNDKSREVDRLLAEYQAEPTGLRDVVLLVPEAKLEQRKLEYPGIEVHAIHFSGSEIGADGWKFLMGAVGNESLYVRQIVDIMQSYGGELTIADLERDIAEEEFTKSDRRLANNRLRLAKRFVRDGARLRDLLKPGRTVIVDMRDEWLEKDQALGLFLVLMHTFAQAEENGRLFNKLMVFDEAHKYISESDLIGEVVSMIREMRHWATSVVIASQDPLSVPPAVLALTSILILHRITAPDWIKHLRKAIIALDQVNDTVLANLAKGEALVWARSASDSRFTVRPQKVTIRPRVTRHGGGTKTAVDGATVR